jgi:hypothetical protein
VTDLDDFDRFLLHTLRPSQLWALLRLSRSEEYLQSFLDIVHEVLGSIGVVKEVLANDQLQGLVGLRGRWWEVLVDESVLSVRRNRRAARLRIAWMLWVEERGGEDFCGGNDTPLR